MRSIMIILGFALGIGGIATLQSSDQYESGLKTVVDFFLTAWKVLLYKIVSFLSTMPL